MTKFLAGYSQSLLLFLQIATHSGFHVCHALLYDGLFNHVDPRSTEGVTKPGPVAGTSLMKNIPGATLDTVFCRGIGSFGGLIEGFHLYDFEGALGISEAPDGLGKAVSGNSIIGMAKVKFLP